MSLRYVLFYVMVSSTNRQMNENVLVLLDKWSLSKSYVSAVLIPLKVFFFRFFEVIYPGGGDGTSGEGTLKTYVEHRVSEEMHMCGRVYRHLVLLHMTTHAHYVRGYCVLRASTYL